MHRFKHVFKMIIWKQILAISKLRGFQDLFFSFIFHNLRINILSRLSGELNITSTAPSTNFAAKRGYELIHIGAHYGQEADEYEQYGLRVLWIEAIPEIYLRLEARVSEYEKQDSICALLGRTRQFVTFYLSSNQKLSSSIFKFTEDYRVRQGLSMDSTMELEMFTLDELLEKQSIEGSPYLVIDVQGAEIEVLLGSEETLKKCYFIEIEISKNRIYEEGPLFEDVVDFLFLKGFICISPPPERFHGNVLFARTVSR